MDMMSSLKDSIKQLANKLDNISVPGSGKGEKNLPSEPEDNPRGQCGAVMKSEAISTRSITAGGKEALLPTLQLHMLLLHLGSIHRMHRSHLVQSRLVKN